MESFLGDDRVSVLTLSPSLAPIQVLQVGDFPDVKGVVENIADGADGEGITLLSSMAVVVKGIGNGTKPATRRVMLEDSLNNYSLLRNDFDFRIPLSPVLRQNDYPVTERRSRVILARASPLL